MIALPGKFFTTVALASTTPAVLVVALTMLMPRLAAPDESAPSVGTVNIDGTATLTVAPDRATMMFEVSRIAPTRVAAETALDQGVADVLAALTKAGARPHEQRTLARTATPTYAHDRHGRPLYHEVIAWTVTQRVEACAHEAAAVATWQKAARAAGAIDVGAVAWETSRLMTLKRDARLQAAAEARQKALALVEKLGGRLGAPTSISESAGSTTDAAAYKHANIAAEDVQGAVVVADSASGTIAVVATVVVSFEILRE